MRKEGEKKRRKKRSYIFLRGKKKNQHRLILNLKNFNKHATHRHFIIDTLNTAFGMVRKNCYIASIDPTDAYYCVVSTFIHSFIYFPHHSDIHKVF